MPWSDLSGTQKLDLFHCEEIPYSTSYAAVDGMGAAYVQTANQPILSAAKNAVIAYVDSMEAIAITDLKTLLDKYNLIRDVDFSMSGGSVGNIQGVSFSAEGSRLAIKRRVQELVPYYKYHEILAKQNGTDGNGMMGMVSR